MTGHRMLETSQNLVIRAFGRHNITLHIDDGCMGGGGQTIPHPGHNRITFDDTDPNNPNYPDFMDYKGTQANPSGYFEWNRKGIFHYCIFVHDIWWKNPQTGQWSDLPAGIAEQGGDDLMIAEEHVNSETDGMAKVFMHELGHNLDLTHKTTKATVMFTIMDPPQGAESANVIDYLSTEWSILNVASFTTSVD